MTYEYKSYEYMNVIVKAINKNQNGNVKSVFLERCMSVYWVLMWSLYI